jgi:four helix bundle protein
MKITKFEDITIWKLALSLTKEIYDITSIGNFAKDYGLRDQIRRAVISISSNIVEGFEKNNNNELVRYLKISKGSTGEVRNQLYIALAIGYITQPTFDALNEKFLDLANQTGKFISYLESKKKLAK